MARLTGQASTFKKLTQPTPLQAHALELTTNAPGAAADLASEAPHTPSTIAANSRSPWRVAAAPDP